MTDPESSEVFEILPVDEAAAHALVAHFVKLHDHPESVALREKQMAEGTFGTPAGAAEFRALTRRLEREMNDPGTKE